MIHVHTLLAYTNQLYYDHNKVYVDQCMYLDYYVFFLSWIDNFLQYGVTVDVKIKKISIFTR